MTKNHPLLYKEIPTSDPILREAMYIAFDKMDFWRMVPITFEEMHIDHIIPVTQGGKNVITNYVITHSRMNCVKNSSLITPDKLKPILTIVSEIYVPKVIFEYEKISGNKYDSKSLYYFFKGIDIDDYRNKLKLYYKED